MACYHKLVVLALCTCQVALAIRSAPGLESSNLEGKAVQQAMAIEEKGQILHSANSSTESSDDEVNEFAEYDDDDAEYAESDDEVNEVAEYDDDDAEYGDDDGADEESFLEEDMADTEEYGLDEADSDSADAAVECPDGLAGKECRKKRMAAARAKRAGAKKKIYEARDREAGGSGDAAAGKKIKVKYEPGKIKRAARTCEQSILKPCTGAGNIEGYGKKFCSKTSKCAPAESQDACKEAQKNIFANMGAAGNDRSATIQAELEKNDGKGFVDAMLASGKFVVLENVMRKQLMACICVKRGGGDMCYEGSDGIPKSNGKKMGWCASTTPSWKKAGLPSTLSSNLC